MSTVVAVLLLNLILDCIIEALANPERERLKHEDTNISEWLKSMKPCSTFVNRFPPLSLNYENACLPLRIVKIILVAFRYFYVRVCFEQFMVKISG